MFAETESSSATTQNYEPRTTTPPYADSRGTPGGGFNDRIQETARFYQPPASTDYPGYRQYPVPPAMPQSPPRKSNAGWWILAAFLCLLLAGAGIVAMVARAVRDQATQPSAPNVPGVNIPVPNAPPPPPPPPGAGSDDSDTTQSDLPKELRPYVYPGAEITEKVNALGNQVVSMTTSDDFKKIREFYKKVAGNSLVETDGKDGKTMVFQTSSSPATIITIGKDEEVDAKYKITLVRSPFVPKL